MKLRQAYKIVNAWLRRQPRRRYGWSYTTPQVMAAIVRTHRHERKCSRDEWHCAVRDALIRQYSKIKPLKEKYSV